jgi:hypothetical protein
MRADIKYLAIGLFIGIIVAFLVLLGLVFAAPEASPVSTFLPVYTDIPTSVPATLDATIVATSTLPPLSATTNTSSPTLVPTPRATSPGPEIMISNGELTITGPLTREQQMKLYEASLQFIARTTKVSKQLGEKINGGGYGSPTLICGPLSLAILQSADLIAYKDVTPHDFWLLNPYISKDRALINKVFPGDKYESVRFKTPLNTFDWSTYPLEPGDFIYIDHGTGGNFDHMLVVNRVDSDRRVYAVTNYGTEDGYIINEALLYDPNNSNIGLFHMWTEKQFLQSGSTGFGGFEVWRLRTP